MNNKSKTQLSAFMSKILRHSPDKFGVEVDEKGFAKIEALIKGIKKDNRWHEVNKGTISDIVETSEKQRFEIKGDKIRARYGHSFPVIQEKTNKELPIFLYHGTNENSLLPIIENKEGIRPMGRQYVHLSETRHFASLSARRRKNPYLLKIDTGIAVRNGTTFYYAGNEVWLSTDIDPRAIIHTEELS